MRFPNPFTAPGNWYKGNLHTHTTNSDGRFTPEEVVRRYRKAGYRFLALTDHGRITRLPAAASSDLLLLLGLEFDGDRTALGDTYHVVGFGLTRGGPVPKHPKAPKAIAWIKERGGEAILAHPAWSGMTLADALRHDGFLGVEVFNTGCHYEIAKGYSAVHWDDALNRGRRWLGFAVDDSHHRSSPNHPLDTARAWIMVKVKALTRAAIMSAIRRGLFYSSWGPAIRDIAVKDGVVSVRTSPVKEINFIAPASGGGSVHAVRTSTITRARFKLRGHERYLRIECRDAEGRWAWANPMFLK
jgi:hypothetical protein